MSKAIYCRKPYYLYTCIFCCWFLSWLSSEENRIRPLFLHLLCVAIHVYTCMCVVGLCACVPTGDTWLSLLPAGAGDMVLQQPHLWWTTRLGHPNRPYSQDYHTFPTVYSNIRFTRLNIYLVWKYTHFEELEIDTTDFLRDKQLLFGQLRTNTMLHIQRWVQCEKILQWELCRRSWTATEKDREGFVLGSKI